MAKKSISTETILDDAASAAPVEVSSPVDNLPVAAGKRRRGRPKKVREAAAAAVTSSSPADGSAAAPANADLASVVTQAVAKAVKKSKLPGPETRKGIVGLVKQVTRQEVARAVKGELSTRDFSAGVADEVRGAVTANDSQDTLTTQHGQSHPFWHLLRNR